MNKNNIAKGAICTILIVSLLCLSLFPSVAISVSTERLSDNLIEKLSKTNSNDEIIVSVFFKEKDDSDLRERLIKRTGKDIAVYEDKNEFYKEVVPDIKVNGKTIKSIVSSDDISTRAFKLNDEKSPLSLELRKDINLEITNEMNKYLTDKRAVQSDMNKEYLDGLKVFFDEGDIVYISECIEMMIVNLSESEILTLSNNPNVECIYYSDKRGENESWHISELIGADSTTGTGSINYNNGYGYDGTGVNIGIIESEGTRYEAGHYSLTEAESSGKLSFIPTSKVPVNAPHNLHSTAVTSIICGRKTTVNGRTYEGLARGANVYQTAVTNDKESLCQEFIEVVDTLILNYNINVINISAGMGAYSGYSAFDNAVDSYIEDYGVVFVKSSGNGNGGVTAPGKAYNAITVGCVETKSDQRVLGPEFTMWDSSISYTESYLSNKPDVVAPGYDLYIPESSTTERYIGYGTSFSAPVVTALVAQLMQDDITCLAYPNYVKNAIMCGASNREIQYTHVAHGGLMQESGAGMVNAINSFEAKDNYYFAATLFTNTNTDYRNVQEVYLNANDTIRVVLSFNKE